MTVDDFFVGYPESRRLYDEVAAHVGRTGGHSIRVTTSQVSFVRRTAFAVAWVPQKHLRRPAAPLVLTVLARAHLVSSRWKEVVEPVPGRFTHHLEIRRPSDVDDDVDRWLGAAWEEAG